jgi:hypothetical protein
MGASTGGAVERELRHAFWDRVAPKVAAGGLVLVNDSVFEGDLARDDVDEVGLPLSATATELGSAEGRGQSGPGAPDPQDAGAGLPCAGRWRVRPGGDPHDVPDGLVRAGRGGTEYMQASLGEVHAFGELKALV